MASWIVHLRVAQQLLDQVPQLEAESFYVGNLAPDCGIPSGTDGTFDPPQSVTHFLTGKGKNTADPERFYREYVLNSPSADRSFLLGYYCHLHTDLLWSSLIAIPVKEKFSAELDRDEKLFWKNVKKDWYGLDHDYLIQNPDFEGYRIICTLTGVDQSPLDFYPENAIISQILHIRRFYQECDFDSDRSGKYLTCSEMDRFVIIAAKDISKRLKNLL